MKILTSCLSECNIGLLWSDNNEIKFRTSAAGHTYLSDYPASGASMQHLACFAGGMIAYGAKDSQDQTGDLKVNFCNRF